MQKLRYALIALLLTTLLACGGENKTSDSTSNTATVEQALAVGSVRFEPEFYPSRIGSREEYLKAIDSYWDGFNFATDSLVAMYDRRSVIEAFADYVLFIEPVRADSLLRALIHRAEASRPVLDLFAEVSDVVLHDPNSPLRNDEYYIPILEELAVSPLMDEYDRIVFEHDLSIARKNRVGERAADFAYSVADGRKAHMSNIETQHLILFFFNPECEMCRDLIAEIEASPLLNAMMDADQLQILAICPDGDTEAWRIKAETMPKGWIVAYDDGTEPTIDNLYDLRAIPSLYLLDSAKRVIVKDGTDVRIIEAAVSR